MEVRFGSIAVPQSIPAEGPLVGVYRPLILERMIDSVSFAVMFEGEQFFNCLFVIWESDPRFGNAKPQIFVSPARVGRGCLVYAECSRANS